MLEGKAQFTNRQGESGNTVIHIRKTQSTLERTRGLLGTSELPEDEGLWITPCNSIHTFGMRYPLDIIYLDKKRQIKKIIPNIKPRRLSLSLLASSVIELRAGTIDKLSLKKGDTLLWVENA